MKQVIAIVRPYLAERVIENLRFAPLEALIVQGDTGTRRFRIQDCPLVVGGSSRSHIRLPGLGPRDEPLLIGIRPSS